MSIKLRGGAGDTGSIKAGTEDVVLIDNTGIQPAATKTIQANALIVAGDYVDDAAAAVGGVAVGELYRTGSIIKVRVA